MIYNLLYNYRN